MVPPPTGWFRPVPNLDFLKYYRYGGLTFQDVLVLLIRVLEYYVSTHWTLEASREESVHV
jgi:hypothetical protein